MAEKKATGKATSTPKTTKVAANASKAAATKPSATKTNSAKTTKVEAPVTKTKATKPSAAKAADAKVTTAKAKSASTKAAVPSSTKKAASKTKPSSAQPIPTPKGMSAKAVSETKNITESQLRRSSKKDYMNEEQLAFFYNLLKQQKEETYEHVEMVRHELINAERETDLIDRAALEDDRALKLRIVDREIKLLKKIDEAIGRIRDGSYGYCDVTGEPIGIERLLLRPTATMSIEAKEIAEDKEKHYADEDRS